jgi:hypothetical protein
MEMRARRAKFATSSREIVAITSEYNWCYFSGEFSNKFGEKLANFLLKILL